jgi:hypothetical protein
MCAVQLHSTSEATVGTEEAPRLLYGVDRFVLFFSPNLNRFMSVISPSGRNPGFSRRAAAPPLANQPIRLHEGGVCGRCASRDDWKPRRVFADKIATDVLDWRTGCVVFVFHMMFECPLDGNVVTIEMTPCLLRTQQASVCYMRREYAGTAEETRVREVAISSRRCNLQH